MSISKMNLLHLLLLFLFISSTLSQNSCNSNDFIALKSFFSSANNTNISSSSSSCCLLPGVTCEDNNVIALELHNKTLSGNISTSLSSLTNLRILNLSSNSLKGPVPAALFFLPKLQLLDLSVNALTGKLPFDNITLPSIRVFNVSYNEFAGNIDVTRICNTAIETLSLSANKFYGAFPVGFSACKSLQRLSLDNNAVSGVVPDDLFGSYNLLKLYLQGNNLEGKLSSKLANLTRLVHIDISMNQFSGDIPDVFAELKNLETFSVEFNKFVGSLPPSFSAVSNLRSLSLGNNSLVGGINIDFSGMPKLTLLDLSGNLLNGSLPESLSLCKQLVTLNLGRNELVGEIPESYKNLTNLKNLILSKNGLSNLSLALEVLQHCPNLTYLILTKNFYTGETMPVRGITGFKNMKVLAIANCALFGTIPQWLMSSKELMVLDISWNRLQGNVPVWLGEFESLFYLDISNNSLTGEVPVSLTEMKALLSPNASRGGDAMQDFSLFTRRNSSGNILIYNQVNSFPPSLVLSGNRLDGTISPGFGKLKGLLVLDLHMNVFSGTIPVEISEMVSLETLDLSFNNLTGGIPGSLTKLNFLATFDVSHNDLSGPIPMGGQFSTFSQSSFVGNRGLCGFHLSPCAAQPTSELVTKRARRNKGVVAGMAIAIGIGTAAVLAVVYLIVSRAKCRRQEHNAKVVADENAESSIGSSLVLLFQNKENPGLTIDEIVKSTNNFDQSSIIGCGGFGLVYKATLRDGRRVAIKRLSGDFCQMEREFQAEVETLSRAQHPNLVLLQGYCRSGNDRLLIYSYMDNGSLDYWLHERTDNEAILSWTKRLRILQGSVRGLAYLHKQCEPNIVHRDIKSSNILLDVNFEAHLADFGLARLILPQKTHVTTDLVGTLGYIPPEYGTSSVATSRGDVYSFGVVLLELLTGRRPVDMCKPKGARDLIRWVLEMKEMGREDEVFDKDIYDGDVGDEDAQMRRVLDVACLCVSESPKLRPTSEQLLEWLHDKML